jgi:hypothetical protein
MSTTYLFRIDMAKDNDTFFDAMRSAVSHVYAGADFRVGAGGWIPDLLRLVVEDPPDRCCLTLIELEATEPVALISCRKYLPEDSSAIPSAFSDYLDRVIRQCHSTADAREIEFSRLKAVVSAVGVFTVTTAGALRSSTRFVEELPLIDQPNVPGQPRLVQPASQDTQRILHGVVRLARLEAEALSRCATILDAVVRHCDHSDTRFEIWRKGRRNPPLKRLLAESNECYPGLCSLVLESKTAGITLDFEKVLCEMVEIWSKGREKPLDTEHTRRLVSRYFSVAAAIQGHDEMVSVFEAARKLVAEEAI